MALAERALGRLAHGGEGLDQEIVERLAVGEPLAESIGAGSQLSVREGCQLGLELVDGLDAGAVDLELAIVRGPEDFGRNRADRQHASGSSVATRGAPEAGRRANPIALADNAKTRKAGKLASLK